MQRQACSSVLSSARASQPGKFIRRLKLVLPASLNGRASAPARIEPPGLADSAMMSTCGDANVSTSTCPERSDEIVPWENEAGHALQRGSSALTTLSSCESAILPAMRRRRPEDRDISASRYRSRRMSLRRNGRTRSR